MPNPNQITAESPTLTDALQEINRLQAELQAANEVAASGGTSTGTTEPIAIVGMGCRFPGGANTPDAYWHLLANGIDAVVETPVSRWDVDAYYDPEIGVPGKMYVRTGGFLDEIDRFDPQFFGMSARESAQLDPQQRLLLEVSWEAIEHAGIAPASLKGSRTGIFVGLFWDDYSSQRIYAADPNEIDRYTALSGLRALSAGRIAHVLDTQGPTIQVDTACSSSLLSVHLACQSLRSHESNLALAGGVSLILGPELLLGLSQMKALSPDGRCKAFDAKADGFGRGEGCGVVVLKRLADAIEDGDQILATIRGSSANHDGHSRTVTTPNGLAQRALLRQALEDAKVEPYQVRYVEAHGTGTNVGDPLEVMALAHVLCQERDNNLMIGSVKTNLGHLDAAAGIAGLMKVVLSLQYGEIPPHLHLTEPNPRIPWSKIPLTVPTEPTPWPDAPKIAGVSSFGMNGSNVHVILSDLETSYQTPARIIQNGDTAVNDGQLPTKGRDTLPERPWHILNLSAKSEAALQDLARLYYDYLTAQPEMGLGNIGYTANVGRSHFPYRLSLTAKTSAHFQQKLTDYLTGEQGASYSQGYAAGYQRAPKIAFLFTGQGTQYINMGRELYDTHPVFRDTMNRCATILEGQLDNSLLNILYVTENEATTDGDVLDSLLNETIYTQPALFALEYSLVQLWRSWGVEPSLVIGHSIGEIVAACTAGVFSLEDGLRLSAARGRLMQALPQDGTMIAVMADEAYVQKAIAPHQHEVSIASINGPKNIVISGKRDALSTIVEQLNGEGIKTRQLTVSHAFHSPLMEPMLEQFLQVASDITYQKPALPLISNVAGQLAGDEVTTPEYWVRHVRDAVRFADGVVALHEEGIDIFLEIGPKPTLLGMAEPVLATLDRERDEDDKRKRRPGDLVMLPSLRNDHSDWEQTLKSLGELYVQGVDVDWAAFDQAYQRQKIVLPTYPFQRQRYWTEVNRAHTNGVSDQNDLAHWLAGQNFNGLTESFIDKVIEKSQIDPESRAVVSKVLSTLETERHAQQMTEQIEAMLYEMAWEKQHKPLAALPPASPGRWLLLVDDGGVGEALCKQLTSLGETVSLLPTIADYADITAHLAPNDEDTRPLRGVIHLWGLNKNTVEDIGTLQQSQERNLASALHVVQQLATGQEKPRLWIVTQGAQQVVDAEKMALTQIALWGLGRVIALEHGEIWGGLIDLERAGKPLEMAQALLAEILQRRPDGETQVAYRRGMRHVARLVQGTLKNEMQQKATPILADASYLITGGLGGLGLRVAQWLAERGAKHLVLTGRQGITNEVQQATVNQLETQGVTVHIAQVDIADASAMRRLFAQIKAEGTPLKGIFHGAGVLDDGVLLNQSWKRFANVLAAKVSGGWLLHQLAQEMNLDMTLDMMVFFSSAASLLGHPGQGNYAAANAFLDGLARYRQQQGLPTVSINWGGWADSGMVARTAQLKLDTESLIEPHVGLAALERLLNYPGQIGVLPIDWAQAAWLSSQPEPFLANFVQPQPEVTMSSSLVQELEALPINNRLEHICGFLQQTLGSILGLIDLPDRATGFAELGVDSLMAMELRRRLERESGKVLPPTIAFEYPTVNALSSYLLDDVLALAEPAVTESISTIPQPTLGLNEPIAVISLACRFPGADTPEAFWQLLQDGINRVQKIPQERWDVDDYYNPQRPAQGKMYTRQGAFIDNVEQFDPVFFGISPREATGMDPHHRLLLEVSWEVLERAGLSQSSLVDSQAGVFVGIGNSVYNVPNSAQNVDELDIHSGTSGGHSVAAGRLAYTLGLQGPTMAVDTACSSSLVALHLACQSLRLGESDLALAGGVSLMLSPADYVELSQMQALAPDGRSKTFDVAADGYGRGEGCGMVTLKRLCDAEAAGDTVLAVIKGSAVNHDGPSSGLTVPNKAAQEKLIRQSLTNAGVTPGEVSYIEAHGTGTPLGDPIEIRALDNVFGVERKNSLLVGSVKTNIGHLEAAAGIAGFIKTVLALHHGQIPPHLHFETPNPHIEWDNFAIEIPTTQQPWPRNQQQIAGVSAFGFSGTNAHVVVAAAPESTDDEDILCVTPPQQLFPLSAKNEGALADLVRRYIIHLETYPEQTLSDIINNAMIGRNHFDHRLSIVATDLDDLQNKLTTIQEGKTPSDVQHGHVGKTPPRLAFLFTGQGAQYVEMGRALYEANSAITAPFRTTLDRCDEILQGHLGKSLLAILYPELTDDETHINQTIYTQPALFALEYALSTLWQSWGVQPNLLMGHSVGEITAACVAGVFSLEDGLKLIAARGRLMQALPQNGTMVSVIATEAQVQQAIAAHSHEDVAIAAVNGAESIVISGEHDAIAAIVAQLTAHGIATEELAVSHAFHSPLMDPMLDDFRRIAESISYHTPQYRLISNVTGKLAGDEITTPEYWVRHVQEGVRFADGVATLHEQGVGILLEIGPKPTLLGMAKRLAASNDLQPLTSYLPSLRGKGRDWPQLLRSLGQLYVQGIAIDWQGVLQEERQRKVLLPTYPFQRQRYWNDRVYGHKNGANSHKISIASWLGTLDTEQLAQQLTHKFNGATSNSTTSANGTSALVAQVLETIQETHEAEEKAKALAGYLYEVTWLQQPIAPGRIPGDPQINHDDHWLILADQQGVGAALAHRLITAGAHVTLVYQRQPQLEHNGSVCVEVISADDLSFFQQQMQMLLEQGGSAWRGIVHLWALDSTRPLRTPTAQSVDAILYRQQQSCGTLLHLLHARANAVGLANAPIWVSTAGAQFVQMDRTGHPLEVVPEQSTLWGMGRVITLEHPEWWGGLIDLDPNDVDDTELAVTALWQELFADDFEEQVAYRQGERYVARLVAAKPTHVAESTTIQPDATYLITGGLGSLGLQLARWSVDQGARHLILTGRRGINTDEQQTAVAALQADGATVNVAQVDVADEAGMVQLFAEIEAVGIPLRGVIHAAGVPGFKSIRSLQWEDFVAMMRPKVVGGWLLHRLTESLDLDIFISYASGAGIWGGKQHAHYGAANHFLDGLMAYRRSQGMPGLSIAWGPWAASGMATPEAQAMVLAMGVRSLSSEQGIAIHSYLMNTDAIQITAADVQWSRLNALYELTKPRRFLTQIAKEQSALEENNISQNGASMPAKSSIVQELETLTANRRMGHIRDYVQQSVGTVLGMAELSDRTTGFVDLGMDSLMAMELREQLARGLNHPLPATIAFEYPTINALASHLLDDILALTEPNLEARPAETMASAHQLRQDQVEPIAVISLACRFPGADTPELFWQLLQDGVDMVQDIPSDRWDIDDYYDPQRPNPGKMYTREGAFLKDVKEFDPSFFGISPREATGMDPHHRLLLEVSWETLERAGLAQQTLADSQTGVFVGIGQSAYDVPNGARERSDLSIYASTSGGHSIAAGRLAYTLGLQGPTMAVDTACSSSLVALHLACQSLRAGECDLALAGGVNLILSPTGHLELSQMQALSADGRCKTFDATADGYGRGEGCGMVALKRLSDAEADDDNILAIIKGSAINHDGASSGLTVPNKQAQTKLLRQVLTNAQVTPDEVAYIEAHGTGTPLGDPIEVRALDAVFGTEREAPLLVGSVKTNIGHLEAASGIAAFIKTVLAVHHGQIPPHLHFSTPNPYIEWDEFAIDVPTAHQPWPRPSQVEQHAPQRIAGVSAFGFSGTNAHVIVAAAPEHMQDEDSSREALPQQLLPQQLLTLSAKSEMALSDLVARYLEYVYTHPALNLHDICRSAMVGRKHFDHRLGIVATDLRDLQTKLQAIQAGEEPSGAVRSDSAEQATASNIAFLFTGQGSQYVDMGRELYETRTSSGATFRATLDRCDELLQAHLNQSLLTILYPEVASATPMENRSIDQTTYTQPALFALEYALAQLWQSWGVKPDVMLGHSIGEIVAACVAGVFSLEDGLKLVAARGRLMQTLPQNGTMVAVMATEEAVEAAIAPYQSQVSIAAINGPRNVIISGMLTAIASLVAAFQEQGIKTTQLTVSHAFHSPLMTPILDEFRQMIETLNLRPPQVPIVSNLNGEVVGEEMATVEYWVQHVREAVRFADGVATLHEQGVDIFLEIGPKPTLIGMAQGVEEQASSATYLPSLRKGRAEWQQLLESLSALYVCGAEIDWVGFAQDAPHRRIVLPTYPFQRERYWVDAAKKRPMQASLRPLIDKMTRSPVLKETLFETEFSLENLPFLADHLVYEKIVSPGACQLALILNAAELTFANASIAHGYQLADIVLPEALIVPEDESRTVQLILTPQTPSNGTGHQAYDLRLVSFTTVTESMATHVLGQLQTANGKLDETIDLNHLRERCTESVDVGGFYATAAALQITLGPNFRWLAEGWRGENEVLGRIQTPAEASDRVGYVLPPGLLDACFQMVGLANPDVEETMLPFALADLQLYQPVTGHEWWCHIQQIDKAKWNIRLLDGLGKLVIAIDDFETRAAPAAALQGTEPWHNWLYQVNWEERPTFGLPLDHLPSLAEVERQLMSRFGQLQAEIPALDDYFAAIRALNALCVDYVVAAFVKAGVSFQSGNRWPLSQLARQLGVVSQHQRLFARLVEMLVEAEVLAEVGDVWEVQQRPLQQDPNIQFLALQDQVGEFIPAELTLLHRCGDKLGEVLRGLQDPLDLLFPGGDAETLNYIYKEAPSAKLMNQLVHEAVIALLDDLPAERGIRILEIGAGTGGTTADLLPHLPHAQTEYVFTDIGATFVKKASESFVEYDFIHYQTLDIEQAPDEQGFAHQQYDLIIAANVLHATRNLDDTLTHVRQLLAPGGRLLMLEGTDRSNWLDLTFGLTDGWWRFADDRADYPLLTVEGWQNWLGRSGFKTVIAAPSVTNAPDQLRQAVIVAQADEAVKVQTRVWLLFADETGLAESLADRLRQQGDRAILVYAGGHYQQGDRDRFQLNPDHAADYQSMFAALPLLDGVVHLWSLSEPPLESITHWDTAAYRSCGTTLHLTQALLQHTKHLPQLWLVTREAQAVTEKDGVSGVAQAPMIGLRRVIALEHPELASVHLDLDEASTLDAQASFLWTEMMASTFTRREDQVAWRDELRYVTRLIPHELPTPSVSPTIQRDATYLITGGSGGLGLAVAHWLVEQGAEHLLLMGRSRPKPETQQALESLRQLGATINVVQADVTDRAQLAHALAQIETNYPLRGIIHAVGVLADGILLHQTWPQFTEVLAPKVQGTWYLHELTQEMPLDFFVLFSSQTGLLGNAGQANHASANTFLDSFAAYRQAHNLPALSINWGAWSEIGAAAEKVEREQQQLAIQGQGFIAPRQGIQAFAHLLPLADAQVAVLPIDWAKFLQESADGSPFFAELAGQPQFEKEGHTQHSEMQIGFRERWQQTDAAQQSSVLIAHLQSVAAKVLGFSSPERIPLRQGLMDLGLDSLTAIELRNHLAKSLDQPLPSTLLFDYPTLDALFQYINQEILKLDSSAVASEPSSQQVADNDTDNDVDEVFTSVLDDAEIIDDEMTDDEMTDDEMTKWLEQRFERWQS